MAFNVFKIWSMKAILIVADECEYNDTTSLDSTPSTAIL